MSQLRAPRLIGTITADLCVVGGGYTGLWTAIGAKRRDPSLDVVLLEGDTVGWGGSGRNGGFMESSLTHGLANGQQRFPEESFLGSRSWVWPISTRSKPPSGPTRSTATSNATA